MRYIFFIICLHVLGVSFVSFGMEQKKTSERQKERQEQVFLLGQTLFSDHWKQLPKEVHHLINEHVTYIPFFSVEFTNEEELPYMPIRYPLRVIANPRIALLSIEANVFETDVTYFELYKARMLYTTNIMTFVGDTKNIRRMTYDEQQCSVIYEKDNLLYRLTWPSQFDRVYPCFLAKQQELTKAKEQK